MRFHGSEGEKHSLDSKDVSLNESEPVFGLVTLFIVGQPAMGGETSTYDEEMCICNHKDDRGGWGRRASIEQNRKPWEI
jgi:hypothetical protein